MLSRENVTSPEVAASPATRPRRILVVGGVAGGMSFAARARRLDETAEIIVFEKGEHPSFANCGLPYFVSGEITDESALLVQTPASLKAALNLDVRVGHLVVGLDATAKTIRVFTDPDAAEPEVFAYDDLVLAPGTFTGFRDLSGADEQDDRGTRALLDSRRASTLRTVEDATRLASMVADARTAVVIGGGYIGIEAVEALRMRGLDVHIVQRGAHVLPRLDPELASTVTAEIEAHGVAIHAGAVVSEYRVDDSGVEVMLSTHESIRADLVVNATGGIAATHLFEVPGLELQSGRIVVDDFGRTSLPHVWAVGDAVLHTDPVTGRRRPVELAGPANRDGRLLADAMLGENPRPRPAALGTSVVRVFDLTVASTGANEADLVAAGMPFESVNLHANSHAAYFPGAETIQLVLHFDGSDGRIYGAQAVGRDGVEKRIDVIATAIRGGLTAADLIDLDLSYAPPFGSAKDPVNMAGMIADNVLTGTVAHWYARDLEAERATALIVDVRRRDEWDEGHLAGAINIPHTELRDRLDEVRTAAAGRPVRVHCRSGMRSYLAHRQLVAAGFDSANLSGGMQTLLAHHGKDILTHEDH